jgi:uncharacterized protein (UPF0335 family)
MMVYAICDFAQMVFFRIFVTAKQKPITVMSQKEAIIQALRKLGGRAPLNEIYKYAYPLADFSGSQDWKATIRWYLQKCTEDFRSPKRGWWELVSYQEEVADLKKEIRELNETIKQIMAITKEAEFIHKFLQEVMNDYKRKRAEADPIRNIFRHMGYEEAAAVLDAWIDEKEDELKKALEKLAQLALSKINVQGDYVINKQVDNEVNGVASGGTGINIDKEKK